MNSTIKTRNKQLIHFLDLDHNCLCRFSMVWQKNEVNSDLNIARPDANKIICDKNKSMVNCERASEQEWEREGTPYSLVKCLSKRAHWTHHNQRKTFNLDSVECERVEQENKNIFYIFTTVYYAYGLK